jgi:hypothetical protein
MIVHLDAVNDNKSNRMYQFIRNVQLLLYPIGRAMQELLFHRGKRFSKLRKRS